MYGHNFEITLGIDVFTGNNNTEFEKAVKQKYPKAKPDLCPLVELDRNEFTEDIKDKLNYRGDEGAGLALNEKEEEKLQMMINKYFEILNCFQNDNTKYFYYSDFEGLPGYPVFWEISYVLFTDNEKIILIYGSASD